MADESNARNKAQAIWQQVRSFTAIWLTLICLGGFVVLVGGPWGVGLLMKLFGPAGGNPGRVITLDMLFTFPFAVYFWIQQRKLEADKVPCTSCGARYPKSDTACPMCGATNTNKEAPATAS